MIILTKLVCSMCECVINDYEIYLQNTCYIIRNNKKYYCMDYLLYYLSDINYQNLFNSIIIIEWEDYCGKIHNYMLQFHNLINNSIGLFLRTFGLENNLLCMKCFKHLNYVYLDMFKFVKSVEISFNQFWKCIKTQSKNNIKEHAFDNVFEFFNSVNTLKSLKQLCINKLSIQTINQLKQQYLINI